MTKTLGRLVFAAWIALGSSTPATANQLEELTRLLESDLGEPLIREWLAKNQLPTPPTAAQLLDLKSAGASDALLLDLVRNAEPPVRSRYRIRGIERIDRQTGRRVLELTNRAEDGSFPPAPPPVARPQPPAEESPASLPNLQAEPIYIPVPVAQEVLEPPPEPRSNVSLRIIPARSYRAYQGSNPPGHHRRFFGPDGYHYPRAQELYQHRPVYTFFDFQVPLFQAPPPQPVQPAVGSYRPHPQRYRSRPVGFRHR